jgi:hypothetical protein
MRQTHTLIRLAGNTERPLTIQMSGHRKTVRYEAPTVEIIEAGTTRLECQKALHAITEESEYLKGIQRRRAEVTASTYGERVLLLRELAIEIIAESGYDWISKTLWSALWDGIDKRLEAISGDYLILPSVHQKI